MALLLLSGLVTQIVGSAGGSNFRRFRGQTVLSNKSMGASKSKLLVNPRLSGIRRIFSGWKTLSDSNRTAWNAKALEFEFPDKFGTLRNITGRQLYTKLNAKALEFEFPDKFGTLRNITGRQLYTKLNIRLLWRSASIANPATINSTVNTFTVSAFTIDTSVGVMGLSLTSFSGSTYYKVSFEVVSGKLNEPSFTRRKILNGGFSGVNVTEDYYASFISAFPYFDNTYAVRVYVTPQNAFGFDGPTLTRVGIVV